jgi:Pyridoxamine 5'-phosphate oxidase
MARWKDVEDAEPEFAARVRKIFDAHKHKTIATLRADGSPRISGIEAEFTAEGELTFGSMPRSRKGDDLRRDPRFALHSASVDPPEGDQAAWPGDAKIAGRAVYTGPVEGMSGDLFRAEIEEVVRTGLNESATRLVIETWTPAGGLRRVERE